jgi:hypothetical protein
MVLALPFGLSAWAALAVFGFKKTMPQPSRGIVQVLNELEYQRRKVPPLKYRCQLR